MKNDEEVKAKGIRGKEKCFIMIQGISYVVGENIHNQISHKRLLSRMYLFKNSKFNNKEQTI